MRLPFRRRTRGDMMGCAHVGRVLQRYLDDRLDPDAAAAVAAHLDMCRRCGLEAAVYQALKASLRHLGEPPTESMGRLRAFADRLALGDGPDAPLDHASPRR